jgi:hypothetical protein
MEWGFRERSATGGDSAWPALGEPAQEPHIIRLGGGHPVRHPWCFSLLSSALSSVQDAQVLKGGVYWLLL